MSAYFLSPKVSLLSCVGGCLPLCASRGFPFVCVYVLSSSPSDEIISLVLSCPGEQQGSEQGDTKKESLGGEGCCHPGVPGWPSCRLLEPGTWESWEEGAWGASHFLSPCSPQAPAGQRPLPAPGLPEGAPAPGHARCCPLVPQASEELCGPAEAVHLREPVAPMFIASSSMMQSDRWMEMTLCPAVLYHTPPLSQNFFVTFFLEHGSHTS